MNEDNKPLNEKTIKPSWKTVRSKLTDPDFLGDLMSVLNRHSIDDLLNIPDFKLAELVSALLETFSSLAEIGVDKDMFLKKLNWRPDRD